MQVFQNFDSNTFTLNGIKYVKNFILIKVGNTNISVHSAYDTKFQLLGSTHYSEVNVNGNQFANQADLMSALAPILFVKQMVDISGYISGSTFGTDTYVSGGTYTDGTVTFRNNQGGIFNVTGFTTGFTIPTLQQVTDQPSGNTTTNSIIQKNGNKQIELNEFLVITDNDLGNQSIYANGGFELADINGYGTFSSLFEVDGANANIGFQFGGLGSKTLNLILAEDFFITGFSSNILYIPNKSGTLATLDDIGSYSGLTLQEVLTNGNISESSINLVNAISNPIVTNSILYYQQALSDFTDTSNILTNVLTPDSILISSTNNNTGVNLNSLMDKDGVLLSNNINSAIGRLTNKNSNNAISLIFPDKPTGEYVLATIEDVNPLSGLTLQQITDNGNSTNNSISVTSFSGESVQVSDTNNYGKIETNRVSVSQGNDLYIGALESDKITFADGDKIKTLGKGTYFNTNSIYNLPDKTTGTYTLATIQDITGFTTTDIRVTGGTYSNGTATLKNNTGGTFTITGFSTGYTLTSSAVTSTLGYTPLSAYTNTFTTGGTYSNGTAVFTNNSGGTFSVTGFSTGSTTTWGGITGTLSGQTDLNTALTAKMNSASPSFTSLMTGVGTTQTGSGNQGIVDLSQTWNTTGTPTAFKLNVINTASNNASLLMDIQLGGSSLFKIARNSGTVTVANTLVTGGFESNFTINVSGNGGGLSIASGSYTYVGIQRGFQPSTGNGTLSAFEYTGQINQTGGASGVTRGLYINPTLTSAYDFRALEITGGRIVVPATNIASGTTGAQTINKISGKVNIAAGASTLVVTNSLVTTSSIVQLQVYGTDITATSARVTLANGSFTITLNATATSETAVSFFVIN